MIIEKVEPNIGSPGGLLTIHCSGLDSWKLGKDSITIGGKAVHIEACSNKKIILHIPENISGEMNINIVYENNNFSIPFKCADFIARGLYISDNPILDENNNIYTTILDRKSEKKLQQSIIKIDFNNKIHKIIDNISDIASIALTKKNELLILSKEKGILYKATLDGDYKILTINLGKSSGITVDSKNYFYIGNIEGEVYKIDEEGNKSLFVKIPPSYISYHMSIDKEDNIYLSNPNIIFESKLYKITPTGNISVLYNTISQLRGLAINGNNVFFIETKRGNSIINKLTSNLLSPFFTGENLIGLATNSQNLLVIANTSTIYKLKLNLN